MGGDSVEIRNRKRLKEAKMKDHEGNLLTRAKFIKVEEEDFKSLFDDYEIWLKKLKEIELNVTFLQQSFVGMLQERDKLFKKEG